MKKWSTPLKVFVLIASIMLVLVLAHSIVLVIRGLPIVRALFRVFIGGIIGGSVLGGIGAGIAAAVASFRKLGD